MKAQVSQDFLYEYLVSHNVKVSELARLSGMSIPLMVDDFRHTLDRHGNRRVFSAVALTKLNTALPLMAGGIKQHILSFGSEQMFTNRLGRTYDPGMVPAMKALSTYFNMNGLCASVLGWSKNKKNSVLCSPTNKAYGYITSADVELINAELLAVAGMLDGIEVVAGDGSSSSSSD